MGSSNTHIIKDVCFNQAVSTLPGFLMGYRVGFVILILFTVMLFDVMEPTCNGI